MNRRQMLAGLASTTLIIGFDPLARRWVRAVEAVGASRACRLKTRRRSTE